MSSATTAARTPSRRSAAAARAPKRERPSNDGQDTPVRAFIARKCQRTTRVVHQPRLARPLDNGTPGGRFFRWCRQQTYALTCAEQAAALLPHATNEAHGVEHGRRCWERLLHATVADCLMLYPAAFRTEEAWSGTIDESERSFLRYVHCRDNVILPVVRELLQQQEHGGPVDVCHVAHTHRRGLAGLPPLHMLPIYEAAVDPEPDTKQVVTMALFGPDGKVHTLPVSLGDIELPSPTSPKGVMQALALASQHALVEDDKLVRARAHDAGWRGAVLLDRASCRNRLRMAKAALAAWRSTKRAALREFGRCGYGEYEAWAEAEGDALRELAAATWMAQGSGVLQGEPARAFGVAAWTALAHEASRKANKVAYSVSKCASDVWVEKHRGTITGQLVPHIGDRAMRLDVREPVSVEQVWRTDATLTADGRQLNAELAAAVFGDRADVMMTHLPDGGLALLPAPRHAVFPLSQSRRVCELVAWGQGLTGSGENGPQDDLQPLAPAFAVWYMKGGRIVPGPLQ